MLPSSDVAAPIQLCNDTQVHPNPTPAGQRGAVILILLAAATFVSMTAETLPVGLLPQIAGGLGTTVQSAGSLVTAYGLVVAIGSVPLSALVARFSRRATLLVVLVVFAVGSAGVALAPSLEVAFVARLVSGAGHAVFYSCAFSIATSVVPETRRGRAASIIGAGNACALGLGVPAATALGVAVGWTAPFFLAAAMFCALVVALALVLPRSSRVAGRSSSTPVGFLGTFRQATAPALVRVGVLILIVMTAHFATYTYVAPILGAAGVAEGQVSVVLLGYGAFGVLGLVLVSFVADSRPRTAAAASIAVMVLVLCALALFAGNPLGASWSVAVWGLAFGGAPAIWQTLALRAAPTSTSTAPAVVNSTFNVGITLGAVAGGAGLASGATALEIGSAAIGVVAFALVLTRGMLAPDRPHRFLGHGRSRERRTPTPSAKI